MAGEVTTAGPLLVECAACENSSEESCAARRHGAALGSAGRAPSGSIVILIVATALVSPSHHHTCTIHNPQLVCDNFNIDVAQCLEKVAAC